MAVTPTEDRKLDVAAAMRRCGGNLDQVQRERLAALWGCSARSIARDELSLRQSGQWEALGELHALPSAALPAEPVEKPPAGFSDMDHGDVLVWVMEELGNVARSSDADGPRVTALKELRVTSRERHEWMQEHQGKTAAAEDAAAARARVEAVVARLPAKARKAALERLTGTEG